MNSKSLLNQCVTGAIYKALPAFARVSEKPFRMAVLVMVFIISGVYAQAQTTAIPTGSFIINMGVTPQTVNNGSFGYADIMNLVDGKDCGYVNQAGELPLAPVWGTKGTKINAWGANYISCSIAEAGINLTAFCMDQSTLSGADPCYFPLNTYIVKTRASASFTAQLKDFAGPYAWGQPRFDFVSDNNEISCDNETATINAVPQRSEVNYLWSTLDGNILNVQPLAAPLNPSFGNALLVNPNSTSDILGIITGTDSWQITVDKVGTYKLDIKLPNDCPVPSGSITIGLDPNFPFFNGSPTYSNTFLCNTNDGTITDTASVAAKPYTFSLCKDYVPLHPGDIIQNNNYT